MGIPFANKYSPWRLTAKFYGDGLIEMLRGRADVYNYIKYLAYWTHHQFFMSTSPSLEMHSSENS